MAVDQVETQKPETAEKSPIEVIFYKGRIFEVPAKTLWDFAQEPANLRERIRLAGDLGLGGMTGEGGIGCWYCSHYQSNIAAIANSGTGNKCIIMNATGYAGISVDGCFYDGNKDIKWASTFYHREKGTPATAQRMPCVAYEALIEVLAKKGLLDQYESKGKQFDYPTINELEGKPARVSITRVEPSAPVKKAEAGKGLLGRIRKCMRSIFGNTY